jgi:hypothetical protein
MVPRAGSLGSIASNQTNSSSASGRLRDWRSARRRSGEAPRISASIA